MFLLVYIALVSRNVGIDKNKKDDLHKFLSDQRKIRQTII